MLKRNSSKLRYICINCNANNSQIFKKFGGSFVKLTKCKNCDEYVDPYVECERSIVIVDLIMQQMKAYKHVLYNSHDFTVHLYMKLVICVILSEGYSHWLIYSRSDDRNVSIKNNEYYFYLLTFSVCVQLITYVISIGMLLPRHLLRCRELILKAIILGQIGRLLVIPAIIYNQSSSLLVRAFIESFVLCSSVQSTQALILEENFGVWFEVAAAAFVSHIARVIFQAFVAGQSKYISTQC